MKLNDLLLKSKDFLLATISIILGLIIAWYWGLKNIAWGSPVITVALVFNLFTAFYIPLLFWGILRGNRPGRWLLTIPILVAIRLWIDGFIYP